MMIGCIKDVENIRRFLTEKCSFSASDMKVLTDDANDGSRMPTKSNIEAAFRWLVDGAQTGDSLFLHYSGHGATQKDSSNDDADGSDETICPVDYSSAGMITDDV
jgi:hypothetical protein